MRRALGGRCVAVCAGDDGSVCAVVASSSTLRAVVVDQETSSSYALTKGSGAVCCWSGRYVCLVEHEEGVAVSSVGGSKAMPQLRWANPKVVGAAAFSKELVVALETGVPCSKMVPGDATTVRRRR